MLPYTGGKLVGHLCSQKRLKTTKVLNNFSFDLHDHFRATIRLRIFNMLQLLEDIWTSYLFICIADPKATAYYI